MQATIKNVPPTWPRGSARMVSVEVSGGPPNTACTIALYRTVPSPDHRFGTTPTFFDGAGDAVAIFNVTLNAVGVSVLHCEANTTSDFDSHSIGTEVA